MDYLCNCDINIFNKFYLFLFEKKFDSKIAHYVVLDGDALVSFNSIVESCRWSVRSIKQFSPV